jgi:hypothetical protein
MYVPVDIYMSSNEQWCKHMEFDLEPDELSLAQEPDETFMYWSEDDDE